MKKILLLSLIVTVSGQGLHAAAIDTINNLSRAAKALPLSTIPGATDAIKKTKKDQVVNVLNGAALVSISVEQFVKNLGATKDAANLLYKRAICIGTPAACQAFGCTNEAACIQKTLVSINQFLTPLLRDLIGEQKPDGIKPGALMSILSLLPKDSQRREEYMLKLANYVTQLSEIMGFLDLVGFSINPGALTESTEETAKISEEQKKSFEAERVQVVPPQEELQTPEGFDPADFQ